MSIQGISMKIADLSRPGRLTAGMNWYRANLSKLRKADFPRVKIPVFGIWSTKDVALAEDQMIGSAAYVDAPWRYERMKDISHWVPVDAPSKLSELIIKFLKVPKETINKDKVKNTGLI